MINEFRVVPTGKEIVDAFFKEKAFIKGYARLAIKIMFYFTYGVVRIAGPRTVTK